MKLQVGLIAHSVQWEELLTQEGISWTVIDIASQEIDDNCSALIVNRTLSRDECGVMENYLKGGGGVLGYALHLSGVAKSQSRVERIEYLFNDHDALFPHVQLMDAGTNGLVPREANHLRTQSGSFAVFAGELSGGIAVILPFDIEEVMNDHRAATKNFYFKVERLPSEQVSLVSKGEVRHLFRHSLEYLHHARGIPYVHTWYFPHGRKNLFAFRIDTDGSSKEDVDELYRRARSSNIGMAWFLDVKSHEKWLQHFSSMVGQEMGVHCYEHQTYPDYEENLKNLRKARHLMDISGLPSFGATAPFGVWNPGWANALDEMGFEYSSEFSFAYDTFPMHPGHDELLSKALQIPIHPICIGSLMKAGYTESRMKEYFAWVTEQKLLKNEPLFFYHHPSHRNWPVMESIFAAMKNNNIENTTFLEYARWWKSRSAHRLRMEFKEGILAIDGAAKESESLRLRISHEGCEAVVPISSKVAFSGIQWSMPADGPPLPADLRKTREFDPRAMAADLYTKMQRKFR